MEIKEILEKIKSCEEKIEKKKELSLKKIASMNKCKEIMIKNGFALSDEEYNSKDIHFILSKMRDSIKNYDETYYAMCDYGWRKEELDRCYSEIAKQEENILKYKRMQIEAENKESVFRNLPELFKSFQDFIVKEWDEFDTHRKLKAEKIYKEFKRVCSDITVEERNKYRSILLEENGFLNWRILIEAMSLTEDEIHKKNVKAAEEAIIELLDRVYTIVGNAISYDDLYFNVDNEGKAILNGFVSGEKGKANVESIYAGGYNIQRLHVRTLVREVK